MPQGTINKSYVSGFPFMDQREILPDLLDVTNEKASLIDFWELMGYSEYTKESQYHNLVNTELFAPGIVSSSSGAPGTTVTVVLTPATAGACISNSLVQFPSGNVAYVQNNNAGTLTINSINGSSIVAADVAAGAALIFPTVSFGEGSGPAAAERFVKQAYTNVIQIFKAKYSMTDIQMASLVEVNVGGDEVYQDIAKIELYLKFRKYIALGLIIGQYSGDNFSATTSGLSDSSGNAVNVTMGLDQYATTRGVIYSLINSSVFDLPDMQKIQDILTSMRAPEDYMWACSDPMNQKLDIFLNALNNSGMLSQSGRFVIEGKDLDVGIKSFNFFNRNYYKMNINLFNDPNTLGYTGIGNISQSAYMIPIGGVPVVGGGMKPRVGTRYMTIPGVQDLKYLAVPTGGLVPPYTNDTATYGVNFSSYQGLQVLGANNLIKVAA